MYRQADRSIFVYLLADSFISFELKVIFLSLFTFYMPWLFLLCCCLLYSCFICLCVVYFESIMNQSKMNTWSSVGQFNIEVTNNLYADLKSNQFFTIKTIVINLFRLQYILIWKSWMCYGNRIQFFICFRYSNVFLFFSFCTLSTSLDISLFYLIEWVFLFLFLLPSFSPYTSFHYLSPRAANTPLFLPSTT